MTERHSGSDGMTKVPYSSKSFVIQKFRESLQISIKKFFVFVITLNFCDSMLPLSFFSERAI